MERRILMVSTDAMQMCHVGWVREVMKIDMRVSSAGENFVMSFRQDDPEMDGAIDLVAKVIFGAVPEKIKISSNFCIDRVGALLSESAPGNRIIILEWMTPLDMLDMSRMSYSYLDDTPCDVSDKIMTLIKGSLYAWDPMITPDDRIACFVDRIAGGR